MNHYPLPANLSAADQREFMTRLDELTASVERAFLEDVAHGTGTFSSTKGLLARVSSTKQATIRDKAKAALANRPAAPALRSSAAVPPQVGLVAPSPAAPAVWNGPKKVTLVLDWIQCVEDTSDLGKDHMSIGGVRLDLGADEEGKIPPIDLGKFQKGQMKRSDIVICSVDLSNAKSFPTRAKAVLYLAEKDLDGSFVDFLTDIHLTVRRWLEEYLRECEFPGEEGSGGPWWDLLVIGILKSADALFALIRQIAADDIFPNPIELTSPAITKADNTNETWGGDLRSKTVVRTVHGAGGTYKLGFYWRREE